MTDGRTDGIGVACTRYSIYAVACIATINRDDNVCLCDDVTAPSSSEGLDIIPLIAGVVGGVLLLLIVIIIIVVVCIVTKRKYLVYFNDTAVIP